MGCSIVLKRGLIKRLIVNRKGTQFMSKLAKINRNVMVAVFIAQLVVLIGYIMQMAISHSGRTIADLIIAFGGSVLFDIIAVIRYKTNKESIAIRNLCFISYMLFLVIALYLRHNPLLYVVSFPIIIVFGYYNDYKFTLLGCLALLAANVLAVVYYVVSIPGYIQQDSSLVMFQLATHIFMVFTLPASVKFINEDHRNNVEHEHERAREMENLLDQSSQTTQLIKNMMANTENAVHKLAGQSRDMSETAETLRNSAESGKEKVNALTRMLNEFSEKASANAENAKQTITLAEKSQTDMTQCTDQMAEAMRSINNIQTFSNEISKINSTIDNIAFQTNILALNASVEAARAGEAGKGFAVVADEVRNLSSKSAEAASETNELIERALSAIEKGVRDIKSAGSILSTVGENAQNMIAIAAQTSESTRAQRDMIPNVLNLIEDVSGLIKDTIDAAGQTLIISGIVNQEAEALDANTALETG